MAFRGLDATLAIARASDTVCGVVVVIIVDLIFLVVFVVVVIAGDSVLDALGETVAVKSLGYIPVLGDGSEEALVDGLAWVGLLNDTEHTVVEMFVELLCVGEGY